MESTIAVFLLTGDVISEFSIMAVRVCNTSVSYVRDTSHFGCDVRNRHRFVVHTHHRYTDNFPRSVALFTQTSQ